MKEFKSVFSDHLSKIQMLNVYCGWNYINVPLIGILLSLTQAARRGWIIGLCTLIAGSALIVFAGKRKYALYKSICEERVTVNPSRAVVADSIFIILSFVFLWVVLFVPYPFTIEEFLHPEQQVKIPFVNVILCAASLIPTILTNNKMLKKK